MMYFIADVCFNSKERAKKLNKTIEEYNQWLIEKWNKKVQKEDTIYIFGTLFSSLEYTFSITKRLNGEKIVILNGEKPRQFSLQEWKDLGVMPWFTNLFRTGEIDFRFNTNRGLPSKVKDNFYYCYYDKWEGGNPLTGKSLNISCEVWNYEPIQVSDVPKIIAQLSEWED